MVQKKRLGEIALLQRGLTYNKGDEVPSSSKIVLRSNNIDLESHSLDLSELKYLREDFVIPDDRKVKKDSIFICMSNGSKQHVGKVAFIDRNMDYAFGGFMGLIIPKHSISAKYVFYACNSSSYRTFLSQIGNGIGITNLRFSELEKFEIPVPSIEEQQSIVNELDLLTGIINKKNAQLRDLNALAQSIFYEMFGDLMVSEKWPRRIIKDLCIVNPSKKLIPSNLQANDTVSFLPMEDLEIKAGYAEPKQTRLLSEVQGSYTFFAEDDVLLAKVTPCFENGKVGIASNLRNGIGFGSSEFFVIRPIKGIVKEVIYFLAQTQHFVSEASKQLTGTSGLRRVPRSFIENLSIAIPPMGLQEAFAERIKVIEKEKITIGKSIQSAQMLLDSRMDAYFG